MALNVLHISDSDIGGGAARGAWTIHRQLKLLGHDSRMLVGRPLSHDDDVRSIKRNLAWRIADRAVGGAVDRLALQYACYPSSFGVRLDPWFRRADVVQLYNLHGSYFSFTALPLLTRSRPVFWVLQDQWAMTGHVAYSLDCERWRTGCGDCPYLSGYPPLRRDTTARLWRLKRATYGRSRLTLVVASRWLEKLVAASPLLARFPVHRIPRGVDTDVFTPGPQEQARRRLGLPLDERVVFFSAWDLNEPRKGLKLLLDGWHQLQPQPLLLLAGGGEAPVGDQIRSLGLVRDDAALADAYRAADVYVAPTTADVQTKTAPEALACGTPCVAFDRGGVTDVVRHLETGYQAPFGDPDGLGRAIASLLGDEELRLRLGRAGRGVVEREYSAKVQAGRYVELYEAALAPTQSKIA